MYQHIDPDEVGNRQRLVVSELAGRRTSCSRPRSSGSRSPTSRPVRCSPRSSAASPQGWTYEAADASFELLLRRVAGLLPDEDEPFRSLHYRVNVAGGDGEATRATARPRRSWPSRWRGTASSAPARATVPVDALDHAFRNAVNGTWPQLDRIHLSDYKVRILEADPGTDATTRVLVSSTDGTDVWDTVGVHPNVVEASWLALSDAYTHAILRVRLVAPPGPPDRSTMSALRPLPARGRPRYGVSTAPRWR
jgi:2-isopropylmalate synthase